MSALGPASGTLPDEELLPVELDDEEERVELCVEVPLLDEAHELVALEAKLPEELVVLPPEVLVPTVARGPDVLPPLAPVHAPRFKAITPRAAQNQRSKVAPPADEEQFESIWPAVARKRDAKVSEQRVRHVARPATMLILRFSWAPSGS